MRNLLTGGKQLPGKPPSGYLPQNVYTYMLIKTKKYNAPRYFEKSWKYCVIVLRELLNFIFEKTILH